MTTVWLPSRAVVKVLGGKMLQRPGDLLCDRLPIGHVVQAIAGKPLSLRIQLRWASRSERRIALFSSGPSASRARPARFVIVLRQEFHRRDGAVTTLLVQDRASMTPTLYAGA
jgi:hypothetical protein